MNIYEKIVKISNELVIKKGGKNNFSNYDYYTTEDILEKLNPLLEKYKLAILFNMYFDSLMNVNGMYKGVLQIIDCEKDGSKAVELRFDIPMTEVKGASQAQNAGATMTYCKRYMLMNAFGIGDKDEVETQKPVEKKQQLPTVMTIVKKIKEAKSDEEIKKIQDWTKSKYNPTQIGVIERAIKERKELQKV